MVIDIVLIILSSVSSRSLAPRWDLNVLEIVLYQSKWSTTAEQDHHSKIKTECWIYFSFTARIYEVKLTTGLVNGSL